MIIFTPNTVIKSADMNYNFTDIVNTVYPIGAIFISVVSTNPNTLFGVGTWVAFATGRTLVGIDTGQTEFDAVEETGGHKSLQAHTHTTDAQGSHAHSLPDLYSTYGASRNRAALAAGSAVWFGYSETAAGGSHAHTAQSTGAGNAQNLQPYIVTYMWKRTA